jgi:hypothetical protein
MSQGDDFRFYIYFRNGAYIRVGINTKFLLPSVAVNYFEYLLFTLPSDIEVEVTKNGKSMAREFARADKRVNHETNHPLRA